MSILAGIISRKKELFITEEICEQLRKVISRDPNDKIDEVRDKYSFIAKIDIGAFGTPAVKVDQNGSISMVAGEPLLTLGKDNINRTRSEDLEILHKQWVCSDQGFLDKTRGTFCAVYYNPVDNILYLIADKLGLRTLYYYIGSEYIVYATALRILENLSLVPKIMDIVGVTEIACFRAPLSDRTAYIDIKMLKPAQIIRITDRAVQKSYYWRWDNIPLTKHSYEDILSEFHEKFEEAVERRLRADHATFAFLSGGLDSRSIVATLRNHNVFVHTFNYAPDNTQDRVFGAQIAKVLGTRHQEAETYGDNGVDRVKMVAKVWGSSEYPDTICPDRPRLVWSGDGGSVGLGHVYLNSEIIELMRKQKIDSAIIPFFNGLSGGSLPSKKIFNKRIVDELVLIPHRGIKNELEEIHCQDPGRSFYLFLMFNDQRRHLSSHFEDIDLHKMEFQLPFFDSYLVETICSSPIDLFLYHGFYMEWIKRFLPICTTVPWQPYPGHIPYPLPVSEGLRYQWGGYYDKNIKRKMKLRILEKAGKLLKAKDFPREIINKNILRLAELSTRFGILDREYIINTAAIFYRYSVICNGKAIFLPVSNETQPRNG